MGHTGAMIPMQSLLDDAQGFETVRSIRWPDGVQCPTCERPEMTTHGGDATPPARQRDLCQSCERRFDDVTHTLCAGPHQPRRLWILWLYGMGLQRSHAPIAKALARHNDDGQQLTSQ